MSTTDEDPWDEYAADWDSDEGARLYARSAHAHLLDVLRNRGPALDGATVCDFGCGTGLLTELVADTVGHVDAVDTSPAMRRELGAKVAERSWTHVTVSTELPASLASHDLVVCSSVLSFVDDLPATVAALAALLRPGGALVHWDWERTADHDHGLTRDEIRAALVGAGLAEVEVGPAFRFRVEGDEVWPVFGAGWVPAS